MSARLKVLLIDDDEVLTEMLGEHLVEAGYAVESANDGAQGVERAKFEGPDLIVLDVMMPEMDGWTVLQSLPAVKRPPVIMLTAKEHEFDKLRAFKLGVDDYITKPFSFAELSARVGAVLRRASNSDASGALVTSGQLTIDLEKRRVSRAGQTIDLTPTEYRILAVLAGRRDVPVSSEELVRTVWGPEYEGEVEHVKHYIWSLRRKLEADPGDPKHLITERGFGYRFV